MNVNVNRDLYSSRSTQGRLSIDGAFECFTLEPARRADDIKPRAIAAGTYPLTIRWSFRFKKHVPHVEKVPGFDAVEQHIGNFPDDTEACTLLGDARGPQADFIGRSLIAFSRVLAKYLAAAVLTNPNSPEQQHIYNVGSITFTETQPL